jgi:hypothetical protein
VVTHGRGNQQRSVDSIDALSRSRKALLGKAERSSQAIRIKTSGTLWTDPLKGANGSAQAELTFSDRNRRWRKSHHKKNLTAPRSKGCEDCENNSCADRGLADRQLVFGIQTGSLVCTCEAAILLKASAIIRKRIALLSACRGWRFPFLVCRLKKFIMRLLINCSFDRRADTRCLPLSLRAL